MPGGGGTNLPGTHQVIRCLRENQVADGKRHGRSEQHIWNPFELVESFPAFHTNKEAFIKTSPTPPREPGTRLPHPTGNGGSFLSLGVKNKNSDGAIILLLGKLLKKH